MTKRELLIKLENLPDTMEIELETLEEIVTCNIVKVSRMSTIILSDLDYPDD
jgi:hypothetical protein